MSANGSMSKSDRAVERIKARGFRLACPACGEAKATITLDLSDLSSCTCDSCGDGFAVDTAIKQLSDRLAAWQAVARWIDLAGSVLATPPSTESE